MLEQEMLKRRVEIAVRADSIARTEELFAEAEWGQFRAELTNHYKPSASIRSDWDSAGELLRQSFASLCAEIDSKPDAANEDLWLDLARRCLKRSSKAKPPSLIPRPKFWKIKTPPASEGVSIENYTRPEYPKRVAELLGMDKRTLLSDSTIPHRQLSPPKGKKYVFDLDAIESRNPDAADILRPDRTG
ncbi:hypothetical protein [Algisphaera agarilytica]|uniref:Uncharacterized protein n=1 Tax=Algisphaera agarilytica TaxID=1385975 RepID=A0A7X0H8C2_9BACT|nr:hypothetical protein [Algisphaera agarilytica]MBB6431134.1 hypothetical protein [Algisphaera agarilytica]